MALVYEHDLDVNVAAGHSDQSLLHVTVITDVNELVALVPSWRRLLSTSPRATEFNEPAATLAWFRWFMPATSGSYVLAVWRARELIGLAPFSITHLRFGPAIVRLLSTVGAEHGYYGEPLLGPEAESVAGAITTHLAELTRSGTTAVHFRRIAGDGIMALALDNHPQLSCHRAGRHARSVVRFEQISDPDQYFARLARKHQVPRRTRRLAELFGHVEYVSHDPAPDAALDDMRDMIRRRFGTGEGPEMFSTPAREAFMRKLAAEMADTGNSRISSMTAGGKRVAVSLDFSTSSRTLSYTTAHDPELARFSLGNLELFEALRYAYDSGIAEVDLGSATFSYKEQWANSSNHYVSTTVTAPGWRERPARVLSRAAMSYRARRIYRHAPTAETHEEGA